MSNNDYINIIGGGLAGSEAAWQAARRGLQVRLFEMRPRRMTGAHRSGNLAELVCSNSLKSDEANTAPRLLKDELRAGDSLLARLAKEVSVPAGGALASPALVGAIGQLTGERDLYFFDAISPIVDGETIDYNVAFKAARYGRGGDDYVNCPMSKEEYDRFYDALVSA